MISLNDKIFEFGFVGQLIVSLNKTIYVYLLQSELLYYKILELLSKTRDQFSINCYLILEKNGFASQSLYSFPPISIEFNSLLFRKICISFSLRHFQPILINFLIHILIIFKLLDI